jgi:hypothetical protein
MLPYACPVRVFNICFVTRKSEIIMEAIKPYSLHNLRISFSGLVIGANLYATHAQVGICVGSLQFYHVKRCQQASAHPAEVCVL